MSEMQNESLKCEVCGANCGYACGGEDKKAVYPHIWVCELCNKKVGAGCHRLISICELEMYDYDEFEYSRIWLCEECLKNHNFKIDVVKK